jgi:hypothetical protein
MIHFSCDRCKRRIDPNRETRHVVTIEIDSVLDATDSVQRDDDRDYLLEIHEQLEAIDLDDEFADPDRPLRRTYDLCPKCYQHFIRDPLAAEPSRHFGFSRN